MTSRPHHPKLDNPMALFTWMKYRVQVIPNKRHSCWCTKTLALITLASFLLGAESMEVWSSNEVYLTSKPNRQGKGIQVYSASHAFPTRTHQNSNYWADVIFSSGELPPPPTDAPAMRAYEFYSKFGMNLVHNNVSLNLTDLAAVKLNRGREWAYSEADMRNIAQLAAAGIKLHIMYEAYDQPAPPMSNWLEWLKTYLITPYP